MKILAIEASNIVASVAVVSDDGILGEFTLSNGLNHSVTLMPLVQNLLAFLKMDLVEIDYIACSCGPGSFTGLRIGIATAKALAHGSNKKIVKVPTLYALAYNVYDTSKLIVPIMDARRGQVYTAVYKWESSSIIKIFNEANITFEELTNYLLPLGKKTVVLGDGVFRFKEEILNSGFEVAPYNMILQKASSVGNIALELAKHGEFCDYNDVKPIYLRQPQAERELSEKMRNNQ